MITSEENHSTLRRFPIRQELNFEVMTTFRIAETGTGQTISIGSKAVLFMTDQVLKLGNCLHLEISWPAIRDEATAVYLLLRGRIVHYEHPHALVAVERHEFQTRSHQKRCSRRQIDHVAFEISETTSLEMSQALDKLALNASGRDPTNGGQITRSYVSGESRDSELSPAPPKL